MKNKSKNNSVSYFDMQFITSSISTTLVLLLLGLVVFFVLGIAAISLWKNKKNFGRSVDNCLKTEQIADMSGMKKQNVVSKCSNPQSKQQRQLSPEPDSPMFCKRNCTYKDHPCCASGGQPQKDLLPDRKNNFIFSSNIFQKTVVDANAISSQRSHPHTSPYQRDQYPVSPEEQKPAGYQTGYSQSSFFPAFYCQA